MRFDENIFCLFMCTKVQIILTFSVHGPVTHESSMHDIIYTHQLHIDHPENAYMCISI